MIIAVSLTGAEATLVSFIYVEIPARHFGGDVTLVLHYGWALWNVDTERTSLKLHFIPKTT